MLRLLANYSFPDFQSFFFSFMGLLSTFLKNILIFSHNYNEICKKYLHSPQIIELLVIKLLFEIPIPKNN